MQPDWMLVEGGTCVLPHRRAVTEVLMTWSKATGGGVHVTSSNILDRLVLKVPEQAASRLESG